MKTFEQIGPGTTVSGEGVSIIGDESAWTIRYRDQKIVVAAEDVQDREGSLTLLSPPVLPSAWQTLDGSCGPELSRDDIETALGDLESGLAILGKRWAYRGAPYDMVRSGADDVSQRKVFFECTAEEARELEALVEQVTSETSRLETELRTVLGPEHYRGIRAKVEQEISGGSGAQS